MDLLYLNIITIITKYNSVWGFLAVDGDVLVEQVLNQKPQ